MEKGRYNNRLDWKTREFGWSKPPQAENRRHRLLFFRCAVTRATDLFRVSRPLTRKTLVQLTRKFRIMTPHSAMTPEDPARVFSVMDRLVPTVTVLESDFLARHSAWMDEALKVEGRTLKLKGSAFGGGPEEDGEFLYLPSLRKCYTLIWRWLSVLVAGEREPAVPLVKTKDCNEILGLLRRDLGLHSTTYLDMFPAWVEPRDAGSLYEKDRFSVRRLDPSKYRFKPWEGVPT